MVLNDDQIFKEHVMVKLGIKFSNKGFEVFVVYYSRKSTLSVPPEENPLMAKND